MEKKFIGFSVEQTSLKIYSYQGPAAADTEGTEGEFLGGEDTEVSLRDRNEVFVGRIFKLQYTESVSPCSEQFKKECGESSLFTDNGRYVIVGSAAFVPEEPNVLPRSGMYSAYNETNINLKNLLKTDR